MLKSPSSGWPIPIRLVCQGVQQIGLGLQGGQGGQQIHFIFFLWLVFLGLAEGVKKFISFFPFLYFFLHHCWVEFNIFSSLFSCLRNSGLNLWFFSSFSKSEIFTCCKTDKLCFVFFLFVNQILIFGKKHDAPSFLLTNAKAKLWKKWKNSKSFHSQN